MHIALIVEHFRPGGGVEGAAWQLARGLADAGDRVSVVSRTGVACEGVEQTVAPAPGLWQPARVWWFARRAAAAARATGAALVHAFARTRHPDLYRAGGGIHAAYLAACHGPWAWRLRRLSPRHHVLLALERALHRDGAQHIQCNSRWVRDALVRDCGVAEERLSVVYNGVDHERFRPAASGEERRGARRAAGIGEERVWLFAGSGFRRKGLDTALRALARSERRDAQLWVAGADSATPWARRAARAGVADRVRFLGVRDLAPLFRIVDGLLLPTRYDAFANVCLEAAASGCPVLTSASNGAAEILGDGGVVVGAADAADEFAAAMDQSEASLRAMGHAAQVAAAPFSWARYVREQRALYTGMMRP